MPGSQHNRRHDVQHETDDCNDIRVHSQASERRDDSFGHPTGPRLHRSRKHNYITALVAGTSIEEYDGNDRLSVRT
jgi:hypothetical protein